MEQRIKLLRGEVVTRMERKFGRITNLDEIEMGMMVHKVKENRLNDLEEMVMKNMVVQLRLDLSDSKRDYKNIVNELNVSF